MKPVKLPYPISFQELLKLSVQTESATRYRQNEGPEILKKPDETPVEAARRRLAMNYPGVYFNLLEESPYCPQRKGWTIEFYEGQTVFVCLEDRTS